MKVILLARFLMTMLLLVIVLTACDSRDLSKPDRESQVLAVEEIAEAAAVEA